MEISSIILAAGNSSRLGRAKQLLILQGKSLILRCISTLSEIGISAPIIVLGARFEKIKTHIVDQYPDLPIIENPNWEQGMSTSLQKGISLLAPTCKAVLICLSDQPLIPANHLMEMIETFRSTQKMVVSAYNDDIGVPALIPMSYLEELKTLTGKKGAKYLLRKYRKEAIELSCPQAAYDIDTEADYRRIVEMI